MRIKNPVYYLKKRGRKPKQLVLTVFSTARNSQVSSDILSAFTSSNHTMQTVDLELSYAACHANRCCLA